MRVEVLVAGLTVLFGCGSDPEPSFSARPTRAGPAEEAGEPEAVDEAEVDERDVGEPEVDRAPASIVCSRLVNCCMQIEPDDDETTDENFSEGCYYLHSIVGDTDPDRARCLGALGGVLRDARRLGDARPAACHLEDLEAEARRAEGTAFAEDMRESLEPGEICAAVSACCAGDAPGLAAACARVRGTVSRAGASNDDCLPALRAVTPVATADECFRVVRLALELDVLPRAVAE